MASTGKARVLVVDDESNILLKPGPLDPDEWRIVQAFLAVLPEIELVMKESSRPTGAQASQGTASCLKLTAA